jgi:hypothetical protein
MRVCRSLPGLYCREGFGGLLGAFVSDAGAIITITRSGLCAAGRWGLWLRRPSRFEGVHCPENTRRTPLGPQKCGCAESPIFIV